MTFVLNTTLLFFIKNLNMVDILITKEKTHD